METSFLSFVGIMIETFLFLYFNVMFSANQSQFLRYFCHLCILINSANDPATLNRVSVEDRSPFIFSYVSYLYLYYDAKRTGFPSIGCADNNRTTEYGEFIEETLHINRPDIQEHLFLAFQRENECLRYT